MNLDLLRAPLHVGRKGGPERKVTGLVPLGQEVAEPGLEPGPFGPEPSPFGNTDNAALGANWPQMTRATKLPPAPNSFPVNSVLETALRGLEGVLEGLAGAESYNHTISEGNPGPTQRASSRGAPFVTPPCTDSPAGNICMKMCDARKGAGVGPGWRRGAAILQAAVKR